MSGIRLVDQVVRRRTRVRNRPLDDSLSVTRVEWQLRTGLNEPNMAQDSAAPRRLVVHQ